MHTQNDVGAQAQAEREQRFVISPHAATVQFRHSAKV